MTIAMTENLKKLDAAMGTPEKKARFEKIYSSVLKTLKLKTKQLELLLELVGALTHEEMKTETERLGIGVSEEMIWRYSPWKMIPKDCPVRRSLPFTMAPKALSALRGQIAALQSTLDGIVDTDTPVSSAPGEKR